MRIKDEKTKEERVKARSNRFEDKWGKLEQSRLRSYWGETMKVKSASSHGCLKVGSRRSKRGDIHEEHPKIGGQEQEVLVATGASRVGKVCVAEDCGTLRPGECTTTHAGG